MNLFYALCLIAKLNSGVQVRPVPLEMACAVLQAELHKGYWSAGGNPSWRVRWIHQDEWTYTEHGWSWHCSEFKQGGESLLVREDSCGVECLTDPCLADSCSFIVVEGHDPPYLLTQGRPPMRDGWIVHHVLEVKVADDARRRVLARELYKLLPPKLKCAG
jgi:hypothetical protein